LYEADMSEAVAESEPKSATEAKRGRKRRDPDGEVVQVCQDKEARLDGLKNKMRRRAHMVKIKREKKKEKKARQEKRRKEAQALGDQAPPKMVPKTLENTREHDETTVQTTVAKREEGEDEEEDEEVLADIESDEFKAYFDRQYEPKVLLTSADNPKSVINSCIQHRQHQFFSLFSARSPSSRS